MKTLTKNVLAASTVLILASVAFSPVSAMNGDGTGGGSGQGQEMYQGQGQGKGNGQGGGQGQGQGQGQKGSGIDSHNPADGIADIAASDLSEVEKDLLLKQYEEEMMANELYTSFYEMYGTEVFKNIAASEAKHMEAVQVLLDRYDIETPTDYDHIKDLYEELKAAGALSEKDALEVGVKIEFVDIDDIVTAIKSTDNDDIKVILTNIGGASYNHLRGFVKALDAGGYETNLDYNGYLSDEELALKGPLKYKLAETLEEDGVTLPEQVSSESMKAKKGHSEENGQQANGQGQGKNAQQGQKGNSENMNKGQRGDQMGNRENGQANRSVNSTQYNSYKTTISEKYGATINALSDDKLKTLVTKIDALSEKIQNGSEYSQTTKQKYNMILGALKEIALEKLQGELDLDELFE